MNVVLRLIMDNDETATNLINEFIWDDPEGGTLWYNRYVVLNVRPTSDDTQVELECWDTLHTLDYEGLTSNENIRRVFVRSGDFVASGPAPIIQIFPAPDQHLRAYARERLRMRPAKNPKLSLVQAS